MTVTDAHEADVVARLLRDLRATFAGDRATYAREDVEGYLRERAAQVREFEIAPESYVEKVVEDVQQMLHDLHLDTTWPAYPRRRRHPLWCHGDAWTCEQDRVVVARLGALGTAR